jgi:two-component system, NarL family, response regulator DevR
MINVMLVDDHQVVRLGLKLLFQDEKDIRVVCEAGDAESALKAIESCHPDVVVMDVRLPGKNGLEACREVRQGFPQVHVVMLTSYLDDTYLAGALRAGASGFVLKTVGGDELLRAIHAASRGEMALDPQSAARLVSQYQSMENKMESQVFRELSPREMDVLGCVIQGMTNKEAGKHLNLSEVTVRNYLSNMLDKMGFKNRTELTAFALHHHYKL